MKPETIDDVEHAAAHRLAMMRGRIIITMGIICIVCNWVIKYNLPNTCRKETNNDFWIKKENDTCEIDKVYDSLSRGGWDFRNLKEAYKMLKESQ